MDPKTLVAIDGPFWGLWNRMFDIERVGWLVSLSAFGSNKCTKKLIWCVFGRATHSELVGTGAKQHESDLVKGRTGYLCYIVYGSNNKKGVRIFRLYRNVNRDRWIHPPIYEIFTDTFLASNPPSNRKMEVYKDESSHNRRCFFSSTKPRKLYFLMMDCTATIQGKQRKYLWKEETFFMTTMKTNSVVSSYPCLGKK